MITVYCEGAALDVDAIVERGQRLLLDRGVSVARGIALLKQCESRALVANFTEEYQHLKKVAGIAFLEETKETNELSAVVNFERGREDVFKLPHAFHVNPVLPQEIRDKLLDLLHRYSKCL